MYLIWKGYREMEMNLGAERMLQNSPSLEGECIEFEIIRESNHFVVQKIP